MSDHLKETIKATLITEENYVLIYNLAKNNDLAISAVKIGNWFVSLTLHVDSLFTQLPFDIVEQHFFTVSAAHITEDLELVGEPSGMMNSYDAKRRTTNIKPQNNDVKECNNMSNCKMTVEHALFMIDRYGSRTHGVLMEYGKSSKEILATFKDGVKAGYLGETDSPKKPFLTNEGRERLHEYFGNDVNGYDE